jgi:2-methylcitrate dehydratase PrpD
MWERKNRGKIMKAKGNDLTKEPTRALAQFASNLRYEDIPADVREKAKLYILDSLGCSIGGYLVEPGKIIVDFFTSTGGNPESQVLATKQRIPCLHAVYVNAYLANALDFDDTLTGTWEHPGGMIIPPGLAVAEKIGRISGKDYLAAVVAGYEVTIRVIKGTTPSSERYRQAWGISTRQVFGSATVAGKLLSLTPDAMAMAFDFAGISAPVPYCRKIGLDLDERPVSWLKNNYGWAAMGGVLAALLTQRGFIGPSKVLDGDKGFWTMCGSDKCDFDVLVEELGKKFMIGEVSFKPYAAARWSHTTLDAVREILKRQPLDPEMVEKITIRSFFEVMRNLSVKHPPNIMDAMFSLPFQVAVTLIGHSPHTGLYEEDLRDPKVLSLADRVSLEPDEEADQVFLKKRLTPSKVTIRMKDGREFQSRVDIPSGSPEKPVSRSELLDKYKLLVSRVLGKEKAAQSMEQIMEIEKLPNVALVF